METLIEGCTTEAEHIKQVVIHLKATHKLLEELQLAMGSTMQKVKELDQRMLHFEKTNTPPKIYYPH